MGKANWAPYFNHAGNKIIFVNEKFCEISGYNREEIVGKTYDHIFPQLRLTPHLADNNASFTQELTILNKSNGNIWLRIISSPLYTEDNSAGIMLVCTDISKLKNIQDELKKREEGYRTFIDQSAVGIWRAE